MLGEGIPTVKKIVIGIMATLSGLVLLFSYRTSLASVAPAASSTTEAPNVSSPTSTPTTSSPSATASPPTSTPTPTTAAFHDGTYTGLSADTRYGPVQVQITVTNGKVSSIAVPVYPHESFRDQSINSQAVPRLIAETVSAQSAHIEMVSGATFTSEGYLQSLQSAIDKAQA
jgi:uncharacterized protein with FMN-binding domain